LAILPDSTDLFRQALLRATEPYVEPPSRWYCDRAECDGEPHGEWLSPHARAAQRPPAEFADGSARVWLIMAGRGFGKTRTGAEWLADQAKRAPKSEWGCLAPTFKDLKEVCIEGESGLLAALEGESFRYNRSNLEIELANGTVIRSYSAETPERVRGPNLSGAWLDEIAQNQGRYPEAYKNLSMAIRRRGSSVQIVATTTPAMVKLVREFVDRDDGSVVVTRGSTFDNRANLADAFIAEMDVRYKGTRFERQELYGELLEDVPGALWTANVIESTRARLVD
jgi:phage terminase large subunit-like protein